MLARTTLKRRVLQVIAIALLLAGAVYASIVYVPWWLAGPTHAVSSPTQVYSIAFSADGNRIVTGHHCCPPNRDPHSEPYLVQVWDTTGRLQAKMKGHAAGVITVAFTPDGKRIVSSAVGDRRAYIWDATTGNLERIIDDVARLTVRSLAVSPDSKLVATSNGGVFDLATGQQVRKFDDPCNAFFGDLAYSPDGNRIAFASSEDGVNICDARTGKHIRKLGFAGSGSLTVAYLTDGKRVLAHGRLRDADPSRWKGETRVPLLWNAQTGEQLPISDFRSPERIAISADGRWLASLQYNVIEVYELETGRLAHTLRLWKNTHVNRFAISPDGKRVAVAGPQAIEIWELR